MSVQSDSSPCREPPFQTSWIKHPCVRKLAVNSRYAWPVFRRFESVSKLTRQPEWRITPYVTLNLPFHSNWCVDWKFKIQVTHSIDWLWENAGVNGLSSHPDWGGELVISFSKSFPKILIKWWSKCDMTYWCFALPLAIFVIVFLVSYLYLFVYLFIYLFSGEEVRARARFWRDQSLLDRANAMELRSCDSLERIAAAAG